MPELRAADGRVGAGLTERPDRVSLLRAMAEESGGALRELHPGCFYGSF